MHVTPNMLAAALEAIPIPLVLFDAELRARQVNAAGRRLLDWLETQGVYVRAGDRGLACVTQRSTRALGCGSSPACSECVVQSAVAECLSTLTEVKEQLRFERKGRDDLFVLVTAAPFEHAGQRLALVTVQDVTEHVHLLQILPVCPRCRMVRTEPAHWDRVEEFIDVHRASELADSWCESCRGEKKRAAGG
jgi:PAS domain-containing protein